MDVLAVARVGAVQGVLAGVLADVPLVAVDALLVVAVLLAALLAVVLVVGAPPALVVAVVAEDGGARRSFECCEENHGWRERCAQLST